MLTEMLSPNRTNLTISNIETNWIPVFQVQQNAYMFDINKLITPKVLHSHITRIKVCNQRLNRLIVLNPKEKPRIVASQHFKLKTKIPLRPSFK